MIRTQRRQVPRMPVKGLAYVNLDSDNGGIILNISEGGLCFQSTGPVRSTDTIRFWFSYCGRHIEADEAEVGKNSVQTRGVSRFIETGSKLAWTDETRTIGGLRFTNLPAEAREQIRDWIRQPALGIENVMSGPSLIGSRKSPFNLRRLDTSAVRTVSTSLEVLRRQIETLWRRLRTGFSGGLVAGILVSAIVAGAFSLVTHRRDLGSLLIELGERFGGSSTLQPISLGLRARSEEVPQSTSPNLLSLPPELRIGSTGPQIKARLPVQTLAEGKFRLSAMPRAIGVKLEDVNSGGSSTSPNVKASKTEVASSTTDRPPNPQIAAPASSSIASTPRATEAEKELSNRPSVPVEPTKVEAVGMRSEKYLEVGKFKEKPLADKTVGQLSQLGFSASVIPWNRFFGKSYQVLVGPYGNDEEAEAAHKNLSSRGFTPRSYERGKRDFSLPGALKVGGTSLPVGFCVVSWESYIPNAIVKIEDDKGRNVTIDGTWVKRDTKYTENAVAYLKNRDGSRTLVEIRFSGMGQALVFAGGSQQVTRR
jgi:cell division septation protein DedD